MDCSFNIPIFGNVCNQSLHIFFKRNVFIAFATAAIAFAPAATTRSHYRLGVTMERLSLMGYDYAMTYFLTL